MLIVHQLLLANGFKQVFDLIKHFDYCVKAKQVAIGKNRRRGRPRLTAPALELQEDEYVLSDTASEDESATKKVSNKKRKASAVDDDDSDYDIFANKNKLNKNHCQKNQRLLVNR
jgi:hypothetical protein